MSGRAKAIKAEIATLEANRPETPRRQEIEATLAAIPDLNEAKNEELTDLLDAFDIQVVYDKTHRDAGGECAARPRPRTHLRQRKATAR